MLKCYSIREQNYRSSRVANITKNCIPEQNGTNSCIIKDSAEFVGERNADTERHCVTEALLKEINQTSSAIHTIIILIYIHGKILSRCLTFFFKLYFLFNRNRKYQQM